MEQYLSLIEEVFSKGRRKPNRTGVDTIGFIGAHRQYDMADGFPAVTTKQLFSAQSFGEMLGFWRGVDNAEVFRKLGVKVWDANANTNGQWLANPYRKGTDDLGRIYGVQARGWRYAVGGDSLGVPIYESIDQLRKVYDNLRQGIDDRREIVLHWNPAELDQMALPPCHLMYQFGLEPLTLDERISWYQNTTGDAVEPRDCTIQFMDSAGIPTNRLCLSMYQRSCDVPLGVPFNIAGYAWLLHVMAHLTNTVPGTFNHFMHDVHIYVNQIDAMREQLTRDPKPLPAFWMNPAIRTMDDMDNHAEPSDFRLVGYEHHPAIKIPFAV